MNMQIIQSYVTLIKDIVIILSTAIAAVIAILGLQTWKKQLKGKTEYELAQKILRTTYQFREALAWVRYPIVFENEELGAAEEVISKNSPSANKTFGRKQRAIYERRWQKVREASIELDSFPIEAEAIWGQAAKQSFKPLLNCAGTLFSTLVVYLDRMEHAEVSYSHEAKIKDHQIVFAAPDEKDNFFTDEITGAIRKIENFPKPYLKIQS